jgi:uncharacterized protein YndB with AHSA1/START domain
MSAQEATIPAIRERVTVSAPPEDAFAAFADGIHAWWPRDATWSGEGLERIGIEGHAGGFCFEIGPQGRRLDWGRVTTWEPPSRLAFTWEINADRTPAGGPAQASQVTVTFTPTADDGTIVELRHEGWERHGEEGGAYRDEMLRSGTWPRLLASYAATVARRHEAPWDGLTT